jgi:hypothetical protein
LHLADRGGFSPDELVDLLWSLSSFAPTIRTSRRCTSS